MGYHRHGRRLVYLCRHNGRYILRTTYSAGSITIDRTAPVVSASPAGGTYAEAQTVILSADEPAQIYYTMDGSDPDTGLAAYSAPLNITETTTLKFMAVDNAGNASPIKTEIYTFEEPEYLTVTVKNDDNEPFTGVKIYAFTESGSSPADAEGTDIVIVDRVRSHPLDSSVLQFWVIADNLRKGAALNAVQIAEEYLKVK